MNLTQFQEISQVTSVAEQTLVIIGTALDGPVATPFELLEEGRAHELLGNSPLADAYLAAERVGIDRIVLYRLNGVHAEVDVTGDDGLALLNLRSVAAGEAYNDAQVTLHPTHLHVTADGRSRSYFFERYATTNELAAAINQDAFHGLVSFEAYSLQEQHPLTGAVLYPKEFMFSGGEDEAHLLHSRDPQGEAPTDESVIVPTLRQRLEHALFGEHTDDISDKQPNSHLGQLHASIFVLADLYLEDDPQLADILGGFCLNKTRQTEVGAIGVVGTRPVYPDAVDLGEEASLEEATHLRALELAALSQEVGDHEAYKYIQVVTGHTSYLKAEEEQVSLAYAYAATQAQVPYYQMMTNKALSGFGKLNSAFRKEDIALLTANGYICIVPSVRRGFVPFSSQSFSKNTESAMAKPHVLRISQYVSKGIAEEMDRLIGESYTKLSLEVALKKVEEFLTELVLSGVIRDYEFSHRLSAMNTVLDLDVALMPLSEVRAVQSAVTIQFPRGVRGV